MAAFEFISYQLLYFIIFLLIIYYKNFHEESSLVYLANYSKLLWTAGV